MCCTSDRPLSNMLTPMSARHVLSGQSYGGWGELVGADDIGTEGKAWDLLLLMKSRCRTPGQARILITPFGPPTTMQQIISDALQRVTLSRPLIIIIIIII